MRQPHASFRDYAAADAADNRDDVLPMQVAAPLILATSLALWTGLWKLAVWVLALL